MPNDIEIPPHDDDAERAVLGAIFLQSDAYYAAAERIDRTAFYRERHRKIWDAIAEVVDDDKSVDVVTIGDVLDSNGTLEGVGGASFLAGLANEVPTAANVGQYLEILVRLSRLRHMAGVGGRLSQKAHQRGADPDELAAGVIEEMRDDTRSKTETKITSEAINEKFLDTFRPGAANNQAWSTGIIDLDQLLGGGIALSRTYYLGGLTKMGKTALAIAVTAHLAEKHDFAVDFYSTEMSHIEIQARYVAHYSSVDVNAARAKIRDLDGSHRYDDDGEAARDKLLLDELDVDTCDRILKGCKAFCRWDLEVDVQGRTDVRELELETRRRKAKLDHDRLIVVADYLQNFTAGLRSKQGRFADYDEVAARLNDTAKSRNVPVFVLFQFDKQAEKRFTQQGKRPRFSNVRGLSRGGNDANHMLIVHRPYRDDQGESAKYTEVHQELSRHGGLGARAELGYQGAYSRFSTWRGDRPKQNDEERADQEFNWRQFS